MVFTSSDSLPLSVLELSMGRSGEPLSAALQESVQLARGVEQAGYARFWIGENHNVPSLASTAPAVMIAAVASATSHIRVGAGCVLLCNHSPLAVAEQYRTLNALFPERVDLGLGRSRGGSLITSLALGRERAASSGEDFIERIGLLFGFVDGLPEGHLFAGVRAYPDAVALPDVWIFGASGQSAETAALAGGGFGFAGHLAEDLGPAGPAIARYRSRFEKNGGRTEPYAAASVQVFCAETDEAASGLADAFALSWARFKAEGVGFLPTAAEAAAAAACVPGFAESRARLNRIGAIGGPGRVVSRLREIMRETGADELILTTGIHDPARREACFSLIAEEWRRSDP